MGPMTGAMTAWALGAAGILVLPVAEAMGLGGRRLGSGLLSALGLAAGAAAHVLVLAAGPWIQVPLALRLTGGLVTAAALAMMAQSLWFELGGVAGYLGTRRELVTAGTYALARHPGFLWHVCLLLGLVGLTGAAGLWGAIPLWGALNAAYAWIEDRLYLPRRYGEAYRVYRARVPMLIPTRRSIAACAGTFRLFRTAAGPAEPT